MADRSRIRLNPVTKEIEIEGSESFVKTYFKKLQGMISEETVDKKKPKAVKERPRKKAMKVAKKKPGEKRITNTDMIVGLIQSSAEGITTTELKEKTGLTDRQIWTIISIAKKRGKIKQAKRGVSVGA